MSLNIQLQYQTFRVIDNLNRKVICDLDRSAQTRIRMLINSLGCNSENLEMTQILSAGKFMNT